MKIFYKGKTIHSYGKGNIMQGKTSKSRLIAQYKFDKSVYNNLLPGFNTEFTNYEVIDEYLDTEDTVENISTFSAENIVTRSIYSEDLPTKIIFGNISSASNKTKSLIEIMYIDTRKITTMNGMFGFCENLIEVNSSNWNTSNVTDMRNMFFGCINLEKVDVTNWDVSKVTTINGLFERCNKVKKINVSKWNTSRMTNMRSMFADCHEIEELDVSNWDVRKVTRMWSLFHNCKKLKKLDLSKWQTNALNNANGVFYGCESLTELDLSSLNLSKVTIIYFLFSSCINLKTLNLSNLKLDTTVQRLNVFDNTPNLNNIIINNSDHDSVNIIISELPTRTTDSMGTLNVAGVDNINQVNISAAEAKYWNIINEENTYFVLGKSKLGQDKLK